MFIHSNGNGPSETKPSTLTINEDYLTGRCPHRKMTSLEDDHSNRQYHRMIMSQDTSYRKIAYQEDNKLHI